jgi:hypothetical protein
MAPWTQAPDPTTPNVWTGRCDATDTLTPATPATPNDFSAQDDIAILEGWEMPETYMNLGDQSIWNTDGGITGSPFARSTTVRSGGVTAQYSLQVSISPTVGGSLRTSLKPSVARNFQYARAYIYISSFTNTNGSARDFHMLGWTDSTGHRSTGGLRFPAGAGSAPRLLVGSPLLGLSTIGTVDLSTLTWYRFELVTERVSGGGFGQVNTLKVYLGDTATLVESLVLSTSGVAMGGFFFQGLPGTANTGNALVVLFDDVRAYTRHPSIPVSAVGGPLAGAGGVWMMYPKAASLSEWTPLSGTNFSNVDEFPLVVFDDDTSYISSAGALALIDTYTLNFYPNTIPASGLIKAVNVRARLKKVSGASSPTVSALYVDGNAVIYTGATGTVSDTSAYRNYPGAASQTNIYLEYATGLDTDLKDLQKIGIKRLVGVPTETIRCTSVWGYMDIQP